MKVTLIQATLNPIETIAKIASEIIKIQIAKH